VTLEVVNLISSSQEEYIDFNPMSTYSSLTSNDVFSELAAVLNSIPDLLQPYPPQIKSLEQYYSNTFQKLITLASDVKAGNKEINQLEEEIKILKEKKECE